MSVRKRWAEKRRRDEYEDRLNAKRKKEIERLRNEEEKSKCKVELEEELFEV